MSNSINIFYEFLEILTLNFFYIPWAYIYIYFLICNLHVPKTSYSYIIVTGIDFAQDVSIQIRRYIKTKSELI